VRTVLRRAGTGPSQLSRHRRMQQDMSLKSSSLVDLTMLGSMDFA